MQVHHIPLASVEVLSGGLPLLAALPPIPMSAYSALLHVSPFCLTGKAQEGRANVCTAQLTRRCMLFFHFKRDALRQVVGLIKCRFVACSDSRKMRR